MPCPYGISKVMMAKIIIIFKFIEPIFWLAPSLIKPRNVFQFKLKGINWLLIQQGFDVQLSFTEKAFKTWYRDLWILFFLNPLIIVFIHLI